ncbi:MAG: HAMP domain-containing sensor histidine kinase [Candidatus Moraniibacteriota bacterium]
MKKQIILLTVGIELFLLSFFISGFLASYMVEKGLISDFGLEQYGLFGMTFFMAMLAYLIVKFEAFNVKMIGAQALVIGLVVLIGSQFFFIRSFINQILTGITLILSIVFGWALIRSIKLEIERKNELQLMSDKLAQANDQLRKLDNAKSEFISIASHQLRTPLTAIKGFISLILEESYGKISTEIKDVLNKVYLSNERLIELVEDLLNLSRIESGRMEYKFEKTNLGEVCREVYDTFVLRAKEKDLTLDLVLLEDSKTEAMTDRSKIREVISNMVDNALKYTVKGGVKIKIMETPVNVTVAVIDTGIGVPAEEMPYLFSKFSRGKDINRLNAGGTGLGLHVARKVMEALHGRIWVESRGANLGSTFFLEVPKEHVEGEN